MTDAGRRRGWVARLIRWGAVVVVGAVALAVGVSAGRRPAPTPNQLLDQVLVASDSADAFHYASVWRSDGVSQTVVGDARPLSGSASISVGTDRYSVILADGTVFLRGNAAALGHQLGLPAAVATRAAGRWIAVGPTDAPFPALAEGLTTTDGLAQILIAPRTSSATSSRAGPESVITGGIPHGDRVLGSASLATRSRSNLPVTYASHGSVGGQVWASSITFSRWNEGSAIDAPVTAVPYSTLQG